MRCCDRDKEGHGQPVSRLSSLAAKPAHGSPDTGSRKDSLEIPSTRSLHVPMLASFPTDPTGFSVVPEDTIGTATRFSWFFSPNGLVDVVGVTENDPHHLFRHV